MWRYDINPDGTQAIITDAEGCTILNLSAPHPNQIETTVAAIVAAHNDIERGTLTRIDPHSATKLNILTSKGATVQGLITEKSGEVQLVHLGAVRWLPQQAFLAIMHPPQACAA